MGNHHSHQHRLLVPITIEQLTFNNGGRTSLSHSSIKELDKYIGNHNGRLEKGHNFSHSCSDIMAEFSGNNIRLFCLARQPDGESVPAEILLGDLSL